MSQPWVMEAMQKQSLSLVTGSAHIADTRAQIPECKCTSYLVLVMETIATVHATRRPVSTGIGRSRVAATIFAVAQINVAPRANDHHDWIVPLAIVVY